VHQLGKKGWPCILKADDGSEHIHHYNDLLDITCKGYSVEDQRRQVQCGNYISQITLQLSSVFEK
jgi:hypothetical protein